MSTHPVRARAELQTPHEKKVNASKGPFTCAGLNIGGIPKANTGSDSQVETIPFHGSNLHMHHDVTHIDLIFKKCRVTLVWHSCDLIFMAELLQEAAEMAKGEALLELRSKPFRVGS